MRPSANFAEGLVTDRLFCNRNRTATIIVNDLTFCLTLFVMPYVRWLSERNGAKCCDVYYSIGRCDSTPTALPAWKPEVPRHPFL